MKKIFTLLVAGMLVGNGLAQDEKSFHAGFRIDPNLSWYKPDDTKKFENNGLGARFGMGLILDFRLADKFWFSSGVGFNFDGGKIKYIENPNDSIGYFFDDNEIVTYEQDGNEVNSIDTSSSSEFIRLDERNFRATYVTIPLIFKMKTKEIGMMKYYFQFGSNIGIKTKGRTDDVGVNLSSTNTPDLTDLNIDSEMALVRAQIIFGAGVEYNVSGSTYLIGGFDFNWGVTNAVNSKSEHLIQGNTLSDNFKYVPYNEQKFLPYNIGLRIGVLF